MDRESILNLILLELMAPSPDIEKPLFDISEEERNAIRKGFEAKKEFIDIIDNIKDKDIKQKLIDLYESI